MSKTILITGATDGIGLATAQTLHREGHQILLHGRSQAKLDAAIATLGNGPDGSPVESYRADLSDLAQVEDIASAVLGKHQHLDVLINNAGVFHTPNPTTRDGLDVRFVVNTIAPFRLTQQLLPIMPHFGRVINLSSAAQAPVDFRALTGEINLGAMEAYAQSKLAITMWTRWMAASAGSASPEYYAVNPGSLLATKMVKEGFGVSGSDIGIGVDVLQRAALSEEFSGRSGQYFDNDARRFSSPQADGLDDQKCAQLVAKIEEILSQFNR